MTYGGITFVKIFKSEVRTSKRKMFLPAFFCYLFAQNTIFLP